MSWSGGHIEHGAADTKGHRRSGNALAGVAAAVSYDVETMHDCSRRSDGFDSPVIDPVEASVVKSAGAAALRLQPGVDDTPVPSILVDGAPTTPGGADLHPQRNRYLQLPKGWGAG